MPCSSIHIDLLESNPSVLRQRIEEVCDMTLSPLRLEQRCSASGSVEICHLRERSLVESVYEDIGEMLGFRTRTDAVARAQIAVEERLRHKLLPVTSEPVANARKDEAFDGQALRLLLHARIADKFEKPALEKNPLDQAGPLLTWWEDPRYAGTVLDGVSISMRAAETVIADVAVVPEELVAKRAKKNPHWHYMLTMTCTDPAYRMARNNGQNVLSRRRAYKSFYKEKFCMVTGPTRTMVVAPMEDYSRPHVEGLLDAIAEEAERLKNMEWQANIMLATDDPYLYPLIRKCLFDRKEKLAAAISLPAEDFDLKRGQGVRISDVNPDQCEEVLLLLSKLARKSSEPWRLVSEPDSQGQTLFLRERTGEEFIEECFMSPQKLEARKREACDALDELFKPLLARMGNPANGDQAHLQKLLASMKHRVMTGKRMTDACATQEGQQGTVKKPVQAASASSTAAMTLGIGPNAAKRMGNAAQPHLDLPEVFLDPGSDDEEE